MPSSRSFRERVLKTGYPNLIVVAPGIKYLLKCSQELRFFPCALENVLRAALSLYMADGDLPLPTPEEMLICNENTTSEEVCPVIFVLGDGIDCMHLWTPLYIYSVGESVVAKGCV